MRSVSKDPLIFFWWFLNRKVSFKTSFFMIKLFSQVDLSSFFYLILFSFFVYWKQSSRSRVAGVNRTLYHQAFSLKKAKCSFWDKSFSETLFDASCLVSGPACKKFFWKSLILKMVIELPRPTNLCQANEAQIIVHNFFVLILGMMLIVTRNGCGKWKCGKIW